MQIATPLIAWIGDRTRRAYPSADFSLFATAGAAAGVVIMETTDQHVLILGFMLAAFLAQAVGRRVMPVPLYRYLATRHRIG